MTQQPNQTTAQIAALKELAVKIEAGTEQTCIGMFVLAFGAETDHGDMAYKVFKTQSIDAFTSLFDAVLGDSWEWELKNVRTLAGGRRGKVLIYRYPYGEHLNHSAGHKSPAIAGLLALIAARVSELESQVA